MADFLKARRIVISDKDFLFIVFGIDGDFRRYFCKLFCGGAVNIVVYRVKRDVLLKPDKFFVVTYVIIAAPPLGLNCKIGWFLHFDNRATRADCVNQPARISHKSPTCTSTPESKLPIMSFSVSLRSSSALNSSFVILSLKPK